MILYRNQKSTNAEGGQKAGAAERRRSLRVHLAPSMSSMFNFAAFAARAAPEPDMATKLMPVAVVTAAWSLLGYVVMVLGPTAALTGGSKAQCKWGDRTFMNMQEQAALFLSSLWTCAFFVSAEKAASLGTAYVLLRALYPIIWLAVGVETPYPHIFLSTFPQYGINLYMLTMVLLKSAGDRVDLTAFFGGFDALGVFVFTAAYYTYALKLLPVLQTSLVAKCFAAGKKK